MSISPATFAALPLFADATPAALDALARRAMEVAFPREGVLFLAESAPRGWYIVLEGLSACGARIAQPTARGAHRSYG